VAVYQLGGEKSGHSWEGKKSMQTSSKYFPQGQSYGNTYGRREDPSQRRKSSTIGTRRTKRELRVRNLGQPYVWQIPPPGVASSGKKPRMGPGYKNDGSSCSARDLGRHLPSSAQFPVHGRKGKKKGGNGPWGEDQRWRQGAGFNLMLGRSTPGRRPVK